MEVRVLMITTLEHIDILDQSDIVSNLIKNSNELNIYKEREHILQINQEAQNLIKDFNKIKKRYDEAQRFGTYHPDYNKIIIWMICTKSYHPDYNKIMKQVRSTKRKMDMNEHVAAFKIAERNLQNLLDEVSKIIATSVSSSIMVPEDGMLAASGCASGSCGTGGSCAC